MNGIYKDNVVTIITIWVIKTMIKRWVGRGTYSWGQSKQIIPCCCQIYDTKGTLNKPKQQQKTELEETMNRTAKGIHRCVWTHTSTRAQKDIVLTFQNLQLCLGYRHIQRVLRHNFLNGLGLQLHVLWLHCLLMPSSVFPTNP